MSGTTHDIEYISGCYDILPNDTLADLLLEKMQESGSIQFSEQERAFARDLQATFPEGSVARGFELRKQAVRGEIAAEAIDDPLWGSVLPHSDAPPQMGGSTEVGDVSWITPTGQIETCCWPLGTPGHSWQTVASCGSSIGAKGLVFAAKAMALAGLELLVNPELLACARADFDRQRNGKSFVSPLPDDAVPR